jgi:hypothetical protein
MRRIIIIVLLDSFLADIRYALRWLRRSPGFTLVAVASLAIGIGFNTTLFAVIDALLFKTLPVERPWQLVDVFTSGSNGSADRFSTSSYPDYLDLKAQNEVFHDVIGYSPMFAAMNLGDRSRLAMGEIVSGNYFTELGVSAARGRTILGRRQAGRGARGVLSHRYWTRESAPDAVGSSIRIRGITYTVVGTPANFSG